MLSKSDTILFSMVLSLFLPFRGVYRFTCFPSNRWFLRWNPCFVRQNPVLPWFLSAVPHVVRNGGRGGSLWWSGGILFRVRVFSRAFSLTCPPNSRFRIPARLLFPQETGETSSVGHSWIGPCNGDWDLTAYPPLYLWNGLFHFLCHYSTQLR